LGPMQLEPARLFDAEQPWPAAACRSWSSLHRADLSRRVQGIKLQGPLLRTGRALGARLRPLVHCGVPGMQLNRNLRPPPRRQDSSWRPRSGAPRALRSPQGRNAAETRRATKDRRHLIREGHGQPDRGRPTWTSSRSSSSRSAASGRPTLTYRHVSFFLNCMDVLMGVQSFVALRDRRVKHPDPAAGRGPAPRKFFERAWRRRRTPERKRTRRSPMPRAPRAKVEEVRQRVDSTPRPSTSWPATPGGREPPAGDPEGGHRAEKQARIQRSKENVESQIRNIQSTIRSVAVLPPIPESRCS